MGKMETVHSNAQQDSQESRPASVDEIRAAKEAEITATARRWTKETTAADHEAIFGGMARSLRIAIELQDQQAS